MWDLIVSVPDHGLSFTLNQENLLHSSISKEWVQKPKAKPICKAADKWHVGDHAYKSTTLP